MRFLPSLSASLLAFALGQSALAGSPGMVSVAGRFAAASAHPDIESAARAALRVAVPAADTVSLGEGRTTVLANGQRVVKMQQVYRGLVVAQRGATVVFGGDDSARLVSARLEEDLPADIAPAITAADAAAIATARTRLVAGASDPVLVIWPTPDGNKLAWAVSPAAIPGIPYAPVVVIDAKSGRVILHYNAARSLNQANVYPSNPVKSPSLTPATLPLSAGGTTLDNPLIVSKNCIDQHSVKMLFGFNVHTCDLLQTAAPDANGDFLIAPGVDTDGEDAFSEVSMFHHANRAYDFFRVFDPTLDVNNKKPLTTVSNLRVPQGFDTFDQTKLSDPDLPLAPFQNAFFAPNNPIFSSVFGITGGAMWFGQGPVKDYSYDGDVVYHEFTHAVVEETLKLAGTPHMDEFGASYSPGAMNEGLADYFSSALTGDPDVGEYASQDFAPGSKAIRTLANDDACPGAVGGEVHQDSTLFSGALWETRAALPAMEQAQLDEAVFTAMNSSSTGDLGYEEFAKLVLDAVTASPLGKAGADALTAAFTKHGVLPRCTRVIEYTGGKVDGPKDLYNLWFAPGTQTTGASDPGYTPGVVQFHQKLPDNPLKITVFFKKVNVNSGGGFGMGGTPFVPKVLVRFTADPIQFTYKPLATTEDVLVLDPVESGNDYSVTIDAPPNEPTDVHVMIGSAGETDGAYQAFALEVEAGPPDPPATTSSGSGTVDETGDEIGGCGCALPGEGPMTGGAALAAIAALGLAAARRRRSSR